MLIQAASSQDLALTVGLSVRYRLSVRRLAKLSGNRATGGANHIRSSLLMVAEDTAAVSTAEVGSS
jgi:hypothetical protein